MKSISILILLAFLYLFLIFTGAFAQKPGSAKDIIVGKSFQVYSKQMHEIRTYSVSLPSSYDKSQSSYPVVFLLDGESYFDLAASACNFMAMTQLMPEAIVVGINNTDRRKDMTPPDISLPDVEKGRGEEFLSFLESELMPVLQAQYRLLPLRILVGHSHGGLLGAYAISAHPNLFRWYLLIDAPMHLNDYNPEKRLFTYFTRHPELTGRMISIEHSFGWRDESWHDLQQIVPKSFIIERLKMTEETHPTMLYPALYNGLIWLFKDIMYHDTLATLSRLKKRYDDLSDAYGYRVPLPQSVLLDAAEDQLMAGQAQEASELVEEIKHEFGAGEETEDYDAWIKELLSHPLSESYKQILSSPRPTPEQIQPFLGTWEIVKKSFSPNKIVITFSIEAGKVTAEQHEFNKTGDEVTPILGDIAYIRMLGNDTLEWGYMNGMRPRTMIIALSVSRTNAGDLEGVSHLKGVSFSPGRKNIPDRSQPIRLERRKK